MRVDKSRSASSVSGSRKASSVGDGAAFADALKGAASTTSVATTSSLSNVNSVAALMALQGAEDPTERKKRAERRGRQMLDGLDSLKLDLLEGRDPENTLQRLKSYIKSTREDSGAAELESLIDQIELRVEVELAKLEKNA
ncbi:flagellar assembly protein FliX [Ponticaulis profundi]|uniref:Flagellar assembly protein FliX n=1 Tax=Ponticaulis profundi TaxID=2665222 RepID=A0ABW1S6H1_9PROT